MVPKECNPFEACLAATLVFTGVAKIRTLSIIRSSNEARGLKEHRLFVSRALSVGMQPGCLALIWGKYSRCSADLGGHIQCPPCICTSTTRLHLNDIMLPVRAPPLPRTYSSAPPRFARTGKGQRIEVHRIRTRDYCSHACLSEFSAFGPPTSVGTCRMPTTGDRARRPLLPNVR